MCSRQDYIAKVDKVFGAVKDGAIDRAKLGKTVFADKAKLALLNSLAHPYIFDKINEIYAQERAPLFVEVSAFDESMRDKFDAVILVKSAKDTRAQRVKLRSGYSEDYALSIMESQMSEEQGEKLADYTIVNDGDFDTLEKQVMELLTLVLK